MKVIVPLAALCLSACSVFGSRQPPPPNPPEVVVTGAPAGAVTYVDGVPRGTAALLNDHPQVLRVKPGPHVVEIHVGDPVVYREEIDLGPGERRVVAVLSGSNR